MSKRKMSFKTKKQQSKILAVFLVVSLALFLIVLVASFRQSQNIHGLTTRTPTTVLPVGQTGAWDMIFSDEFSGTTLDGTKWTTCYPWYNPATGCTNAGNYELEWYMPNNVIFLGDGLVRLRAKIENVGGKNYSSGMISSGATPNSPVRFSFQYGFFETRMKLPFGSSFWPAFWLLPIDQGWPPELDAMENWEDGTSGGSTKIAMNVHFSASPYQTFEYYNGPDFTTGFHVFGVDWEPTYIRWYVDGILRKEFTTVADIPNKLMYLLVNLALDGNHTPNPAYFPADALVDYVRVWKRSTATPTPTPQLTATPTPIPPTPTSYPTAAPTPIPDPYPPVVTITSPLTGTTIRRNSTVIISASATDNVGVTKVEFYVNGALICSDTIVPYTCNWNVGGKPGASYTLRAKAYDASNNSQVSSDVIVSTAR